MFFTKYPHRANFSFSERYNRASGEAHAGHHLLGLSLTSYEDDVYHLQVESDAHWSPNGSLENLILPPVSPRARLSIDECSRIRLKGKNGQPLWTGRFGVSGRQSLFEFELHEPTRFYGMGQKTYGKVELSGFRSKFWSTDVWSDFHFAQWMEHPSDPPYFSLPYLAARVGEEYVGFLLHNPYPAFMETPGTDESRVFVEWQRTSKNLMLGSEGGQPNLWIIYGPSLDELTCKLQRLVGVTPMPPAWALGYHQSRWGYGGEADLRELDQAFSDHQIPCDSLWLDLDYMNGFRIFETSSEMFPKGADASARELAASGRRIVPILDPGVKAEPGYRIYDEGHAMDAFCHNPEGGEFVGLVWPGETVFPDFTLPEVRAWWAGHVEQFAKEGFGACWVDMNDPSTGPVDPTGMRFNHGREDHEAHHNQYALGMQMATREGFLRARPDERPFMLSRSGTTGSSGHSAIWTGDNLSNYFYLRTAIPTSLGMSLSGLPFNGPDIGGFGGDVTDALMIDWVKACFLFPFFRNHSGKDTRPQEPFNFDAGTMKVLRRYIRLRYKMLPYLYNLFAEQEQAGRPILRPLFYHFEDEGLDRIDDQFLVGEWVLQAPFVKEGAKVRSVTLPGTESWLDAASGEWMLPGQISVRNKRGTTPLFLRAGAMVPMQAGTPRDNRKDLLNPHIHVLVPPAWSGESAITYVADDGISFAYAEGARSEIAVSLAGANGYLAIACKPRREGFGAIAPTFVFHSRPQSIKINGREVGLKSDTVRLTGRPLPVWVAQGT